MFCDPSFRNFLSPGSEGIEPPTAVPKTDVLPLHQPPIYQSNKPGSVLGTIYLLLLRGVLLHFHNKYDKLARATVYRSSDHQSDWV